MGEIRLGGRMLKSVIRPTDKVCWLAATSARRDLLTTELPAVPGPAEKPTPPVARDRRGAERRSRPADRRLPQRQICSHRFLKLTLAPGTPRFRAAWRPIRGTGARRKNSSPAPTNCSWAVSAKGKNLITLGLGSTEVCRGVGEPPSDPVQVDRVVPRPAIDRPATRATIGRESGAKSLRTRVRPSPSTRRHAAVPAGPGGRRRTPRRSGGRGSRVRDGVHGAAA